MASGLYRKKALAERIYHPIIADAQFIEFLHIVVQQFGHNVIKVGFQPQDFLIIRFATTRSMRSRSNSALSLHLTETIPLRNLAHREESLLFLKPLTDGGNESCAQLKSRIGITEKLEHLLLDDICDSLIKPRRCHTGTL